MRYAWDLYFQYLKQVGLDRGVLGGVTRALLHYLRIWDSATANRPDVLVADSHYVARRIWKLYRRESHVIYPPGDVARFEARTQRDDFYLTTSRLVPYKRIDLIVQAFTRLGLPLIVIGDGPELGRVARLAGPNVQLLGECPDSVVEDHMQRCKAFVFAADEDFGITPVEAQAAGAPVIAYGTGGVTETVVSGETGIFFPQQTVESLEAAVRSFEAGAHRFHPERLRRWAEKFGRPRFKREFAALVDREWTAFRGLQGVDSAPTRRKSVAG